VVLVLFVRTAEKSTGELLEALKARLTAQVLAAEADMKRSKYQCVRCGSCGTNAAVTWF
jgi:hypothetical protein